MRLVDLLPNPSLRVQRVIAALVILTQGGIAVTGAIVRVTATGVKLPGKHWGQVGQPRPSNSATG